jgi:hypothetical protein
MEKYGGAREATDDNVIQSLRFACWITKATDTLRICNHYHFSPTTVVPRTHLSVTLYAYCLVTSCGGITLQVAAIRENNCGVRPAY